MSARSVWSGTRPSRYHSVRAISMPFRRQADMILMPCAPRRIEICMARVIGRRNMLRCTSCWASCVCLIEGSWFDGFSVVYSFQAVLVADFEVLLARLLFFAVEEALG